MMAESEIGSARRSAARYPHRAAIARTLTGLWRPVGWRRSESASKLVALHTLRAGLGHGTSRQRMECAQLAGALARRLPRTPVLSFRLRHSAEHASFLSASG